MGLWIKNADGTIERTAGGGADGLPGVDGEDGQPGVDGNMWHVGSGAPAPTLGEPGDYYLDGTDGWVHVKRNDSSWTNLYVNLTGPPGSGGGGGGDFLPLTGGTLTGDLTVDGHKLWLKGGKSPSSIYNYDGDADRTVMRLVAGGDHVSHGAMVSLYGGDDAVDPHTVRFHTNNQTTFELHSDQSARLYGQAKAINGTAAKPAYSFDGDPDTGLYRNSDNNLAFTAGGVRIFRIDKDQGAKVFGDLTVDGQILAARGSGTAPGLSFASYKGTGFYPGSNNIATHVNGAWQFVVYDDKSRVIKDLQVDGQTLAQNGSAAAPAYSFTSAPNAGMWYDTGSQKGIRLDYDGKNAIYIRAGGSIHPGIFMKGVYDSVMNGYATSVGVTSAGQLVRLASFNRSDIKETEAVSHAATNNVYDLQPVWFRSTSNTDNPEHSYYGLIADDCAAIDPRLATYRADKDGVEVADDVNTDAVVALLVSAVKSQRDTIADLTARIETLEGQTRL
jgi:hypothetical protein